MVVSVETVVAASHAIRVYQRNDLEAVFFKQKACLLAFRHQKVHNTVEDVRTLNFTRMHSCREEDGRLVKFIGTLTIKYFSFFRVFAKLRQDVVALKPIFSLMRVLVSTRDCDELEVSHLFCVAQQLSVHVDFVRHASAVFDLLFNIREII